METQNYGTQYPAFGTLPTVSNTPVGGQMAEIAGYFDKIAAIVQKNAGSQVGFQSAYTGLTFAWGGINAALLGKVNQ